MSLFKSKKCATNGTFLEDYVEEAVNDFQYFRQALHTSCQQQFLVWLPKNKANIITSTSIYTVIPSNVIAWCLNGL